MYTAIVLSGLLHLAAVLLRRRDVAAALREVAAVREQLAALRMRSPRCTCARPEDLAVGRLERAEDVLR